MTIVYLVTYLFLGGANRMEIYRQPLPDIATCERLEQKFNSTGSTNMYAVCEQPL